MHAGGDGRSNGMGIIVLEEISKQVVRAKRWERWIIMAWVLIQRQMVCYVSIWATNRKDWGGEVGIQGHNGEDDGSG